MIEPSIKIIEQKKLIGMPMQMSLMDNKTRLLFRTFMPRRKEIQNRLNEAVFDLKVYSKNYYTNFSPAIPFAKWALMEVSAIENIPSAMEAFILPAGQYAVFKHKGAYVDNSIFQYIFSEWLPKSDYVLDDRPHFDVLDTQYQANDPEAEQEIWIPVQSKTP